MGVARLLVEASESGREPRQLLSRADIFDESLWSEQKESLYCCAFPDVLRLIDSGLVASARQHYVHYGYRQGRDIVMSLQAEPALKAIVLCPSIRKRCGIGQHARYLTQCLQNSGLAVTEVASLRELDRLDLSLLRNAALVIDHGPGLFDGFNAELSEGDSVSDVLAYADRLKATLNVRPLIFMHTLLDIDNAVMFPRQQLWLEWPIPVVTMVEDGAQTFGIFHIELGTFPLPQIPAPPQGERRRDHPTIGFFGFPEWGGKNFDALFEAAKWADGRLTGSLATSNAEIIDSLRRKLEDLQVPANIGSGWAEDKDLIARLSAADYYYLPQADHDVWNNSGSARYVLNFSRPVFLPPYKAFHDLRDYAIFAEEGDIPALMAWLRDPETYDKASARSVRYVENHAMLKSMPRLVSDLAGIASESGSRGFATIGVFAADRLMRLTPSAFAARLKQAWPDLELPGDCGPALSVRRAEVLAALRRNHPDRLQMNRAPVAPIQYWRDHYEIDEFLFPTFEETFFHAYRAILKREPGYREFMAARDAAGSDFARSGAPFDLIDRLLGMKIDLDFAPAVQIYRHGAPLPAQALAATALRQTLLKERATLEGLLVALPKPDAPDFSNAALPNLFAILALPDAWRRAALTQACRRGGLDVSFEALSARAPIGLVYREVLQRIAKAGGLMTDLFLMDRPTVAPMEPERVLYCPADFWAMSGDEFVFAVCRAVLKREPLTIEMFALGHILKSKGKLAALRHMAAHPSRNAEIALSLDYADERALDANEHALKPITEQMRSPYAGGWDLRNAYLENKRNYGRAWHKHKKLSEPWWKASGKNVEIILGASTSTDSARKAARG